MTEGVNLHKSRLHPGRIRCAFFAFMTILAAALLVNLVEKALDHNITVRKLVIAAARMPSTELSKPIPCERAPLVGENDRTAVLDVLGNLNDLRLRAAALCLLGDAAGASATYDRAANAGDGWSALQAYYLHARSGEMAAAESALDGSSLSSGTLNAFFNDAAQLDPQIDLLPLARKIVMGDPTNPDGWSAWLQVGERSTRLKDWPRALDVYQQALSAQAKLGVPVGRSSFALNTGRIYQANLDPHQPQTALSYYDQALAWDEFLSLSDKTYAHIYRGEVYRRLRPAYTDAQVLAEFQRALEISPQNYSVTLSLAIEYLIDLKNFVLAEKYIRQAMALLPENPNAYLYLGDLYRQQGDLVGAAVAYQQALLRQPGWQAAVDRLAAVQAEMEKTAP
jgi:tetratricopeptide (TPR) repeat protein